MAAMTVAEMAGLAAAALALSVAALWIAGALLPEPRRAAPASPPTRSFLLRDGALIDTDADDGPLPAPTDEAGDDWSRLCRWFAPRFALPDRPAQGIARLISTSPETDPATLEIDTAGARTRVTLSDPHAACPAARHALLTRLAGAAAQGAALTHVPVPVWLRDRDGRVAWENAAAAALPPEDRARLLSATGRVALENPARWFDLATHDVATGTLVFATHVTPLVRAQEARRDFIRTLGRSFADLPPASPCSTGNTGSPCSTRRLPISPGWIRSSSADGPRYSPFSTCSATGRSCPSQKITQACAARSTR
jgi:PAS domain-containing protein